jgi:C_GCAxxG_C_C family probable redox protein
LPFKNKAKIQALGEVASKRAAAYFDKGRNCCQAVMLGGSEALGIEIPALLIESLSGAGGGLGLSGCLCGALLGGTLLLGLKKNEERNRRKVVKLTNRLHETFRQNFGSTCCRVLRKGLSFNDPKLKIHCRQITAETTRLAVELIGEL